MSDQRNVKNRGLPHPSPVFEKMRKIIVDLLDVALNIPRFIRLPGTDPDFFHVR